MKKIILASILCFVGAISLSAQSKSTIYRDKVTTLKSEQQIVSASHSNMDALMMVSNAVSPKMHSRIIKMSNTPIENAGSSLKRAGQMLYWGTVATAVGQLLTLVGEPGTGTLLSLAGTIVVWSGYTNITKAGRQLEQSANN